MKKKDLIPIVVLLLILYLMFLFQAYEYQKLKIDHCNLVKEFNELKFEVKTMQDLHIETIDQFTKIGNELDNVLNEIMGGE